MPRTASRFTQAEIRRAVDGARQAGARVIEVVLPESTLRIFIENPPHPAGDSGEKRRETVDVRERPVL